MDRLIALVLLRWRLDLRAATGARSRLLSLLVALPALALLSVAASILGYSLVGMLERGRPELVLPVVSLGATAFGLSWALSPLLAGISATDTHDLGRLMHYPVPLPALVLSSLLANLLQPLVLAQLPPILALSLALAERGLTTALALGGLLLSLAVCLAVGQAVGLAVHALTRQRRWHDRVMFVGIGTGVALSLLPLLVVAGGPASRGFVLALLEHDAFALVPFSWGARAAVHAGRGEALPFAGWALASAAALAGALLVSTGLAQRLYRGDLDLGEAKVSARRSRLRLPGAVGALVEKDLRVTWRDPRLKALVFTGLLGPLLVLVALWQGASGRIGPGLLLSLAAFAGLGVLGSNVFGLERHGLAMLFGFPVDRLGILVAKNIGSMVLRLPALVLVLTATLLSAGVWLVPAVLSAVLATQLLAAAVDNFVSVLAPLPVAGAGRDPGSTTSGGRGLGAAALAFASMLVALALASPFVFLTWLPYLLGRPALWLLTLPLALGGAAGVYFMLASWAARLLERREPELVARAAGEP